MRRYRKARLGASVGSYAIVVGVVAVTAAVALEEAGDQKAGLLTRVAGSVNAVDGALAGNQGPRYAGTLPGTQAVDAYDPLPAFDVTGFVDPEGDSLTYSLRIAGGLGSGELSASPLSDGVRISGWPGATGSVSVVAHDPIGRTAEAGPIAIEVAPNQPPIFMDNGVSLPTVRANSDVGPIDIGNVSDPETDDLSYSVSDQGSGQAVNFSASGSAAVSLSGRPDHAGTVNLTIRIEDAHGAAIETGPFSFQVLPDNRSCRYLLQTGGSTGDGVYTIDPDRDGGVAPFDVYCDMSGGGWARVSYTSDLPVAEHFADRVKGHRYLSSDFSTALSDAQLDALRAVSTEGRQRYVGLCDYVVHHYYIDGDTFNPAARFRLHDGSEIDTDPAEAPAGTVSVAQDGCKTNGGEGAVRSTATIFDISSPSVPIVNIALSDMEDPGESYGSPLTQYPAWLR